MPKIKRGDYGIHDEDVNFSRDTDEWLNKIEPYEKVLDNPSDAVINDFKKSFLENEQLGLEMFRQLEQSLIEFNNECDDFNYEDMDIVKLMSRILLQFKSWIVVLRRNTFLAKNKLIELETILAKHYITKIDYEHRLEELQNKFYDGEDTIKEYGEKIKVLDEDNSKRKRQIGKMKTVLNKLIRERDTLILKLRTEADKKRK